jgi:predicted transcriptional regulator
MSSARQAREQDDVYARIRALAHPIRVEIIETMGREAVSPVVLHRRLPQYSLPLLSYHVKVLHRAGVLYSVGTKPRRGAIEHFYRAGVAARDLVGIFRDFEMAGRHEASDAA